MKDCISGLKSAIIGSVLTIIGDFLIGANSASDVPTGVAIIDLYGNCIRNSELRMVMGGMLGVVGMPLTGIGYHACGCSEGCCGHYRRVTNRNDEETGCVENRFYR